LGLVAGRFQADASRYLSRSVVKTPLGISIDHAPPHVKSQNHADNALGVCVDTYVRLLISNKTWAATTAESNSDLFPTLSKGQHPEILWIGCSDSRCPETTILGLKPGDVFVHRNIANILTPTDLSSLAVIQFAVENLKVKHIVVSGHTKCGGVAAAMDNKKLGLIDTWLRPLRALRRDNLTLLESLEPDEAALKLVELNIRAGIRVIEENPLVIDAIAERDLQIHGNIYDVGSGRLRPLDIKEDEETVRSRKTVFKIT